MESNKQIYFAVKGLVIKDNKILIVHKADLTGDVWELPGGRMQFGETAEDTLVREMKEETGYDVIPVSLLDTWNFVNGNTQITGIVYSCKIMGGNFRLSSEHDSFKWINPKTEQIKLLAEPFRKIGIYFFKDEE